MEAEILKDELDKIEAENTILKARNKELREALKPFAQASLHSYVRGQDISHDNLLVRNVIGLCDTEVKVYHLHEAQQALLKDSNGKEALQKDLDEARRFLKFIGGLGYSYDSVIKNWTCPVCFLPTHTKTCELSSLIKDLEAKRDRLVEALEVVGLVSIQQKQSVL